ncbi:hypothetical protein PILCRDRAFT_820493 [Piloderma croceum F 1598]|uniref:Uncharacterized protein n=1 Tax=Piloderma croceum (strain F 1598) TaxID=765440 RepID=A0A0C3BZ37_PILCF|nr:hypothetical protein PILCRDRAFT_820493 [Piloderma croceum F 1598]
MSHRVVRAPLHFPRGDILQLRVVAAMYGHGPSDELSSANRYLVTRTVALSNSDGPRGRSARCIT